MAINLRGPEYAEGVGEPMDSREFMQKVDGLLSGPALKLQELPTDRGTLRYTRIPQAFQGRGDILDITIGNEGADTTERFYVIPDPSNANTEGLGYRGAWFPSLADVKQGMARSVYNPAALLNRIRTALGPLTSAL